MMSSSAPQFPVLHQSLALDIKGHKTELVRCSYEDHFLIVASQIGAFGTILHARKEEGVTVAPTFSVSVIFGKRDERMLVACARQLIENIRQPICPELSSCFLVHVLLAMDNAISFYPVDSKSASLGLKNHSLETVKGIVSAVIENRRW